MRNNKDVMNVVKVVIGVIILIVVVSGLTYAVYNWVSNTDNGYISGTSDCFIIDYTKGEDILSGSMNFSSDYTEGLSTTVKARISSSCGIETGVGTLYLDTKDTTSDYLINNNLIRYQVLEDGKEVASGTVSSKGEIPIYKNIEITQTEKSFTVYIWLSIDDVTDENLSDISVSTYSCGIQMSASMK